MNTEFPGKQWSLRAFRSGDEALISQLFQRVFQRSIALRHWLWKLKQRPSSVENAWLIVDANERAIFHYAGIPCSLNLPSGQLKIMVSVDAMTDPDCQRQGLLSAGAARVFESWRRAGIDLTLGLPNQRWGSRTQALGWQPLFPLQWRVRLLRPDQILARRLPIPGLARLLAPLSYFWNAIWDLPGRRDPDLEIDEINRVEEELDHLADLCRGDQLVSIVRGGDWVEWRYLAHPSHTYHVIAARRRGRLAGYLVYRTDTLDGRRLGYIAELVAPRADRAVQKALLNSAIQRLRIFGADAVFTLAVPKSEPYRCFSRAGFIFSRGSFMVHCVPLNPDLDLQTLRDPCRWWMVGGDFDVI